MLGRSLYVAYKNIKYKDTYIVKCEQNGRMLGAECMCGTSLLEGNM
jgi:hypothetical protein